MLLLLIYLLQEAMLGNGLPKRKNFVEVPIHNSHILDFPILITFFNCFCIAKIKTIFEITKLFEEKNR